jgi:putative flippase GtrA
VENNGCEMKIIQFFRKDLPHFVRYAGIGVINTVVGYGLIFTLMFFGINPFLSNGISYAVGIIVSYILNRNFNFRSEKSTRETFPKFVGVLLIAYLLNLAALFVSLTILHINKYIAQLIAGVFYTLFGFYGNRYITFVKERQNGALL